MEDIKHIIKEQYKTLPPELRQVIESYDWTGKVESIGKKYTLHIDKIGILGNETTLVLLGLSRPDEFIKHVATSLEINNDQAIKIATEVNTEVFLPIQHLLKEMYEGGEEEIDRDETLNGIENPSPVKPAWKPEAPKPAPIIPAKPAASVPFGSSLGEVIPTLPPPPRPNIVEQKLGGSVKLPVQAGVAEPKTYKADPYRESF